MTRIFLGILVWLPILLAKSAAAGAVPEYTAAEAKKHIGEKATVVGKVECIGAGRTYHYLQLDACSPNSPFWIIVNDNASGPELDVHELQDVTIAVTGKIERQDTQPWIVVKSTTQIVPRTPKQTNYIGHAYDKEQKGDIDGAIADLNKAIEHQLTRRDEACAHLASLKAEHGDWQGALAAYDKLIAFDPNKADSYWVRATAKEKHGDFEGAMADFTHAAELRNGNGLVEVANKRKAHGDLAGAMADYDKAIAFFDRKIARVPDVQLYFQRGYAKEMKGDTDGAMADYSQAIALNPTHAAGVYSRRGDIRKARGDLAGAIADYQHAFQITQHPNDKEKLDKAKAETKAGAKKVVVTQPSIQAVQNAQSSNKDKDEASPESMAVAFVQAYSGADVDTVASLYADRVDYTNSGVISKAAVRAEAQKYFARWPVRRWSLVGPLTTVSLGTKKKMIFSASYDVSNPQTNNHTSGIAKETLILTTDASGAMKIVSQKEQTNKNPAAEAQVVEKANSPDGKYSIEVVRGRPSEDSLVISKGEEVIAKVPTPVGPEGSFFQTLWSPDEKYVAINKQRSSRSGGDEMWIVALPSGKVLRQPEDALWNELEERADACIDEKHLSEAGGKVFFTLTATGWGKGGLRFRLEAGFGELQDGYPIRGHVQSLRSKNSRLENFEGEMMSKNTFLLQALMAAVAASTLMWPTETAARAVPEYSAAEARKHIDETCLAVNESYFLCNNRKQNPEINLNITQAKKHIP